MKNENMYDVVIAGAGPAGLTAAIYLARACYRVLVVEKEKIGGQITITEEVVNYPGIEKTDGKSLTAAMHRQAENFGAEFLMAEVEKLDVDGEYKIVHTNKGDFSCYGILLATGAHPRMIGFEGEKRFKGRGVAYCATCDGEFFTGKEIFVVGGGYAAAEESVFLTKYASHVTILIRGEDFSCPKSSADKARANEKITVLTSTEIVRAEGEDVLTTLVYKNVKTGEESVYHAPKGDTFGIFVFAGYEPETSLLQGKAEIDEKGYVITDASRQTSISGVYAAGDVCQKNLRQVVTAVGDGAVAATELERYVAAMQKKNGAKQSRNLRENKQSKEKNVTQEKKREGMQPVVAEDTGYEMHKTGQQKQPEAEDSLSDEFFDEETEKQLDEVFDRMAHPLIMKLYLNQRQESAQLKQYMEAMSRRTGKLSVIVAEEGTDGDSVPANERPFVRILREDGSDTGLGFHGVPGGHEFTSFVIGLYNAAGPGQEVDAQIMERIHAIKKPLHIKILVTLACSMCPDLVTAAQKIAAENPQVTAEIYDVMLYPSYQKCYKVMSVPCLVVNDEHVAFGRKTLPELLDYLDEIL